MSKKNAEAAGAVEQDMGWTIIRGVAIAAAGLIASKVIGTGWKLATGGDTPEDDDEATLVSVIAFAVLTAVLGALLQHFSVRKAASWYGGKNKSPEQLLAMNKMVKAAKAAKGKKA